MRTLCGLMVLALVACSQEEDPVDGTGNHYPRVISWTCTPESGVAPLEATCMWQVRDADIEHLSCALDVGNDGTDDQVFTDCPLESGTTVTLKNPGENLLRLHVTDARGLSDFRDSVVVVEPAPNSPPSIVAYAANPPGGGTPLPVTFTFGVVDVDGDPLMCRVLEGDQVIVATSACGSNESRTAMLAPIGNHTLTLEVTDGRGGKDTRDAVVTVASLPQVGDLRISKLEWAQTIVSPTLRLVEGKDALLRIYVLSQRTGVTGVTVKVEGTKNGTPIGELNLTGPSFAPVSDNPNDLTQQWRVTVPGAWITPGLTVKVRVDPANQLGESDEANNELVVTPGIGFGSVLPVTHVPIVQQGMTGTPRMIDSAMKQIWPVKGIDNKSRAAYTFSGAIQASGSGWDPLLGQLDTVRRNDGSRRDYLGWIRVNFGSGVAGLGYVGRPAALTRDDEIGTSVHELGHNMSREHAPCGGAGSPDPSYPVASGHLDGQGYDPVSGRLVSASQFYDVMSYCDPGWVSQFNYKGVQAWLEAHPVSASSAATAAHVISVSGRIHQGRVELGPLNVIETTSDVENDEGEYLLTLYGATTVRVPFGVARVADGLDDAHFSLLVPEVPGLYAVEVSLGGRSLAMRVAGPAQPAQRAAVKKVSGGVELSWDAAAFPYASLAHLSEAERTTLTLFAEGGRAFVSTFGLAEGGAFEVSLSDGVQTQRVVLAR